jgi:hypothetical protein
MATMASPYANPYGSLTKVNVQGPSAQEREGAKKAGGAADLMRLLAGAAPLVGAGVGALAGGLPTGGIGAAPGMAIGGALGSLAGSALGGGADQMTQGYEDKDIERRRKLEALQRVAGLL